MLDESSNVCLSSEHIAHKIEFLDNKENCMSKIEDCGKEYHGQNYLEVFHRALHENDQVAQRWLQQKFNAILLNWLRDHPKKELACRLHTEEFYIIETFRRFWHTSLNQQQFDFTTMADVMSYLHVSMNGVILDMLRNFPSHQETSLTSMSVPEDVQPNENDNNHKIWELIEGMLSDSRERRMAYLLFHCALKPREILSSFPDEFSDAHEISHLRRNIMEFLSCENQIYFAMNKI